MGTLAQTEREMRKVVPYAMFRGRHYTIGSKAKMPLMLLADLGTMHCSLYHDRIYSLLSVVREADSIPVDYQVSAADLAFRVLRACGPMCLCCIATVVEILPIATSNGVRYDTGPFVEFDRFWPSSSVERYVCGFRKVWCCNPIEAGPGRSIRVLRDAGQCTVRVALWALPSPDMDHTSQWRCATDGQRFDTIRIGNGPWNLDSTE